MNDDHNTLQELLNALNMQNAGNDPQIRELLNSPGLQPLLALQQVQAAIHTKLITDRMPGGFFIYRADGDEELLYCNQALIQLFGCDTLDELKELTGNSFRGIVHPDDLDSVEISIAQQIENSQYDLDYVEYRIVQKDGTIRWIEDYGHFIASENSGGFFYVFVADATDKRRRQIEERAAELESINQELRRRLKIIEGFSLDYESIFYVDLDEDQMQPYQTSQRVLDIENVGQLLQSFTGFHNEYIARWVHPEDRERVSHALDPDNIRRQLSRSNVYQIVYRIIENDKPVHLQLHMADVGPGDHVSQIVLGYRRVDDEILREVEQRELLSRALSKANAAVEAKNTFLSNMSHDLRTPMNTVMGYISLAKKNLNDPDMLRECLDEIEKYSSRTLSLIGDVLELSQMESGTIRTEESACDLLSILRTVQADTLSMAAEKNIQLSLELTDLKHSAVYCDAKKLEQTLLRLVNNAVKYTPRGGQVKISAAEKYSPASEYAAFCFTVKDNGIGIDPEKLSGIFDPFERQTSTTLSGVPGMGLGLTLARSMVELMGGTLTVESTVGEGSSFFINLTLPIRKDEKEASSPLSETAVGGQYRILLVEDNDINRELFAALLEDAGFLVDTAENGQVAVDKIRQSEAGFYTLVLMDIQMPVMDGHTAARTIRAFPDPALANIPIVALSANSLEEDRKRSMESGMNAHLPKPIQMDVFLSLLKEFTGGGTDGG